MSIDHIRKEFHHKVVLKDVSFTIPTGSIFAFLGSNGAGKSTLLNIAIQILLPTSGRIFMNGKEDSSKDELTKVEIENGDSISVIFICIY